MGSFRNLHTSPQRCIGEVQKKKRKKKVTNTNTPTQKQGGGSPKIEYKREMSDAVGNEGGGPKREKMWSSINGRMRSEYVSILLTPHPSWFSAPRHAREGENQKQTREEEEEKGEKWGKGMTLT